MEGERAGAGISLRQALLKSVANKNVTARQFAFCLSPCSLLALSPDSRQTAKR